MTLAEVIQKSKKDEKKIRQEHSILATYQKGHPWHLEEAIENMRQQNNGTDNIPSIDELLEFKEHLLVDSIVKVFQQIKKSNPLLIDNGPQDIYYYVVKSTQYKNQLKKGYGLGDIDDQGGLVTGSNLLVHSATINLHEFLSTYYSFNN